MASFREFLNEAFDGIFKKEPVKTTEVREVLSSNEDDGALTIHSAGNFYGQYLDLEKISKTEEELITRYREVSQEPEFDYAISEIVNELIVIDEDEDPVKINLDEVDLPDSVKTKISEEFDTVLKLLNFASKGYDIVRQWYVDGRLYYHKIIDDKNPGNGIQELRNIDPRKIKKVKEIVKKENPQTGSEIITQETEYFLFSPKSKSAIRSGLKIHPDRICYVHSGLKNPRTNMVISHINKSLKRFNQLRLLEESVIIYRFSRAPERRVFYIGTGTMPPKKAEKYVQDLMNKFKNKIVYDAETGAVKEDKKFSTMLEDYWLPRASNGDGTQIQTIGGSQLSNGMEDVNEFRRQFFLSLNVPLGRLEPSQGFSLGRSAEISREEVKFARFNAKLRVRFSDLFDDLLTSQIILKGIILKDDWDQVKDKVKYKYNIDTHFKELLDQEVLQSRITLLRDINEFTPRMMNETLFPYFSTKWIKRHILMQTDQEVEDMDKENAEELEQIQQVQQLQQTQADQAEENEDDQDNTEELQKNVEDLKKGNEDIKKHIKDLHTSVKKTK